MKKEEKTHQVDNFNQIKDIMYFEHNDFYFVQILQRRKDNPELNKNIKVVKSFFIDSVEDLERNKERIKDICIDKNARAYININKRNYEKVSMYMIKYISDSVINKNFKNVRKAFEVCAGNHSSDPDKKWIVDIDADDIEKNNNIVADIMNLIDNEIEPEGKRCVYVINTKSGIHLISRPFNIRKFKEKFPKIDVLKDNPTILFIP